MMLDWLLAWAMSLGLAVAGALPAWGVLTAMELAFPRGRRSSLLSYFRGLLYWLPSAAVVAAIGLSWNEVLHATGWTPVLRVPLDAWFRARPDWIWLGYVISPLVGLLMFDFSFYWMHRFQHRFLWRFHAVHHAIEDLSGINSYPHWIEGILKFTFMTLPWSLLYTVDQMALPAIVMFILVLHGHFIHSNTRLHLGFLRIFVADNRFHRVHHSVEPQHFDKNFGSATTFWDRLFGTAYFPNKNEWPATGVADAKEADTLADSMFRPFARPQGRPSAPSAST